MRTLTFWLVALRGLTRLSFNRCPHCAGNAPETFSCVVCGYGGVHDRFWQERWLELLRSKYL
ncbi:MAG: hypothetical protein NVS3B25_25050 [Hymenobacter sp.]